MASTLALKPRLNWWEVNALCHPGNRLNISIIYTLFLFLSSFYSYVFWLGDFNYRINETIENIKGLCGKQEYSALWPHDQVFESILYIYIVMYSVLLLYCGSSTVIKEVDHQSRIAQRIILGPVFEQSLFFSFKDSKANETCVENL